MRVSSHRTGWDAVGLNTISLNSKGDLNVKKKSLSSVYLVFAAVFEIVTDRLLDILEFDIVSNSI